MAEHNPRRLAPAEAGELVSHIIRVRRLRVNLFRPQLFADPAWDVLLELFHADLREHRMETSELAEATSLPASTAGRWIGLLDREGLLRQFPHPLDARRIFVELSARGSNAMRRWLEMWIESHRPPDMDRGIANLLGSIYGDRP